MSNLDNLLKIAAKYSKAEDIEGVEVPVGEEAAVDFSELQMEELLEMKAKLDAEIAKRKEVNTWKGDWAEIEKEVAAGKNIMNLKKIADKFAGKY